MSPVDPPTGNLLTPSPGPEPDLSLLMLRHGETPQSLERRFSGRTDLALTSRGEQQAAAAARRLADAGPLAAVLSSPLRRARQTAEAVAERIGARVVVDDRLREIDFGEWEGLTFAEARAAGGEAFARWQGAVDLAPPGGESQLDCLERMTRVRDDLAEQYAGGRVLVVTHVTPIKSLLGDALGGLQIAGRINLDLCSLSRVDYVGQRAVVKLVNEFSYLAAP